MRKPPMLGQGGYTMWIPKTKKSKDLALTLSLHVKAPYPVGGSQALNKKHQKVFPFLWDPKDL